MSANGSLLTGPPRQAADPGVLMADRKHKLQASGPTITRDCRRFLDTLRFFRVWFMSATVLPVSLAASKCEASSVYWTGFR